MKKRIKYARAYTPHPFRVNLPQKRSTYDRRENFTTTRKHHILTAEELTTDATKDARINRGTRKDV